MFVANGQGTEETRSRVNLARSAFSRLQSCLWSRREMSAEGRVYQAVMRSILLYGYETWPVRVADERMLEVFDNDSIRRILHVRHWDCGPSVELRHRLYLTSIPALLVQRRLRWFGHAARWADQGSTSAQPASYVAQANWRPVEDVGRHGTPVQITSLLPRTMEKGQG